MKRFLAIFIFSIATPLTGSAVQVAPTDFKGVIELSLGFIQGLTGIAWILFVIAFIYGVIKFLVNFDDEHAREEGKRFMVWSLVATAIAFTIWGIISFLTSSVFGNSMFRFGIPILTPPAP